MISKVNIVSNDIEYSERLIDAIIVVILSPDNKQKTDQTVALRTGTLCWEDIITNLKSKDDDCVRACLNILQEGIASPREMSRAALALEAWEEIDTGDDNKQHGGL